ncbi:hypothetical protein D3C84_957300 [compost metagenome]
MDLLANVPNWDEIERNLDYKFGELNQSISQGWQNAQDGWTASLDALTPNLIIPMVNWVEIGLTLFERRYTGQTPSS